MQNKFILFISTCDVNSDETLTHKITDFGLVKDLHDSNFFNDIPTGYKEGDSINVVLNIPTLKKHRIYKSFNDYLVNHLYNIPSSQYYILELRRFINETSLYEQHKLIVAIVDILNDVFAHNISEDPGECVGLLIKENRSLVIPINYDVQILNNLKLNRELVLDLTRGLGETKESEKKSLFLNELIDFLVNVEEKDRFQFLLKGLNLFLDKANQSYEYYLRDFSYNKLKVEIDSKLLDFSQKLQAVINDSQNKLVAIPAGFVLVLTALDFKNILSLKNLVTLAGLFIFVLFLKIFINNQKSALRFIKSNIQSYKKTFDDRPKINISEIFKPLEKEYTAQKKRLLLIELLLWLIPVASVVIVGAIICNTMWIYMILIAYAFIGLIFYLKRFYLNRFE